MKKLFKLTALALSVIMLCLMLCSCQALDDLRASTGVYTDDEKTAFTFKDKLYKHIDIPDGKYEIIMDQAYYSHQFVITKDVPVLLSDNFGESITYSHSGDEDPIIIRVLAEKSDGDYALDELRGVSYTNYSTYEYYVREDKYDEVKKIVDEAAIDTYYLSYYDYHYDDYFYEYDYDYYDPYVHIVIDDDSAAAVTRNLGIERGTDPKKTNLVKWSSLDSNKEWYYVDLYPCDKNRIITDGTGPIKLITDTKDYYLFYESDYRILHKVADEDVKAVSKIHNAVQVGDWMYITDYQEMEANGYSYYDDADPIEPQAVQEGV